MARERARAPLRLQLLMFFAVLSVAALAAWDAEREGAATLADFASDQALVASSVADAVSARLRKSTQDRGQALDEALAPVRHLERPRQIAILVAWPGTPTLHAADGRELELPEVSGALGHGERTLRLTRAQAAIAGLDERMAVAGLATGDGGGFGTFGVAVLASAARERDRETRARWRLLVTVLAAAGLVLLFGGIAIREQRRELGLAQDLAVAELTRDRDERLGRLERAATMLTLASGFAHELSTPLGVIMGRAEQIQGRANGDERIERSARVILEQSERLGEVVKGFLQLARGGAPRLEEVTPARIAEGARQLVEHRFSAAGVTFETALSPAPEFRAEPRLLEQAVVNLLVNSCEACERGGNVRLAVSHEANLVRFAVTDDGPGISENAAARATEPFFTTKDRGTGLGLAIVSEIARIHHGRFEIAPAEGGGTRAVLEIPVERGAS